MPHMIIEYLENNGRINLYKLLIICNITVKENGPNILNTDLFDILTFNNLQWVPHSFEPAITVDDPAFVI